MGALASRSGRRFAIAALALGGIAAVVVVTWFALLRDVAEPTTVGEAVTNFRESGGAGGASPVPLGVYVYGTDGFEQTDALTGVTHRYPPRSTITVTKDPCGVHMRWDVLKGRSTVWTFCISSGRWMLESQDERHTFFGRTERTTYTCPGVDFWPKGEAADVAFGCTTPAATERGHVRVLGLEDLRVDGRPVATVHLRKTSVYRGEIRGTSAYDFWLYRKSGLPVQAVLVSETTNDSAVGDVHYEERVRLELASLAPQR